MWSIIATEFVTLDGVMEDPGGAERFEHGGWTWPYFDDEIKEFKFDEMFESGALLLGRVTYQAFAAAWPTRTDPEGFADRMNSVPKYVVSTTLDHAEWNNSRLIKGDVVSEIAKLKEHASHDILIAGSGQLLNSLMEHDLVDEYRLMTFPVVLGSGKRLFKDGHAAKLKLVDIQPFRSGVVLLCYRPDRSGKAGTPG